MAVRESVPVQSVEETDAIGLDRAALVKMYRDMLLTRGLEDRGTTLFKQGKLPGSFYTGRGNEAASVGVASAMGPGDVGAPLHRNMGVHVARGAEPWRLLCQYMGRDGGATRGRDSNLRSQDLEKGLIAGVSHLPGILPTALGVALAFRITNAPNVALGWFGDGASARGDVHECMNFAAVRRLPWSSSATTTSTPTRHRPTSTTPASTWPTGPRATASRASSSTAPTSSPSTARRRRLSAAPAPAAARRCSSSSRCVWTATRSTTTRATCRPSCTPRGSGRTRSPGSRAWLRAQAGWTDEEASALAAAVQADVDEATQRADASPWPDPATVTDGVYA